MIPLLVEERKFVVTLVAPVLAEWSKGRASRFISGGWGLESGDNRWILYVLGASVLIRVPIDTDALNGIRTDSSAQDRICKRVGAALAAHKHVVPADSLRSPLNSDVR